MSLFLFIIIVAIVLGIIGVVGHALWYLLVLGIVLFLVNFVVLGGRLRSRRQRPPR